MTTVNHYPPRDSQSRARFMETAYFITPKRFTSCDLDGGKFCPSRYHKVDFKIVGRSKVRDVVSGHAPKMTKNCSLESASTQLRILKWPGQRRKGSHQSLIHRIVFRFGSKSG